MKPIICAEPSTIPACHSGAPHSGGEPGIHDPRPVVMDSGLAASRRPGMTGNDSNFEIAGPAIFNARAEGVERRFMGMWPSGRRPADCSPPCGDDTMRNARSEKWLHSSRSRNRQRAGPRHHCTAPCSLLHRSLSGRSAPRRTLQGDRVVLSDRPRLLHPGILAAPDHPSRLPAPSRRPQG